MAYTPSSDLEVVRRRERELASAKTRAEVDALDERWRAEDLAWREAADWRTQQVRDLTQRIAALERVLGPGCKRLIGVIAKGFGAVLGKARVTERERLMAEVEKRGYVTYSGVWDEATDYARGALVTHGGSAWVALTPAEKGLRPGKAPAWRLMAKGDAGKGVVTA